MKRLYLIILLSGSLSCMFFSSCGRKENNVEINKLISERDSLLIVNDIQNQKLENMNAYFTEISDCLDSIAEQENILLVSVNPETNMRYSSSEMRQRLNLLSEILFRQRERISNLTDSLSNSKDSTGYKKLSKLVEYLSQQLDAKEARIKSLLVEISKKNKDILQLSADINVLKSEVSEVNLKNEQLSNAVVTQTKMLNEGYLLIGDKKKLQNLGIMTKGNLLKKSKLNLDNINLSICEIIDISEVKNIPLNSNKPKILSPVPSGSYNINEYQDGGKVLVIKDPAVFWSLSNVLVIQL